MNVHVENLSTELQAQDAFQIKEILESFIENGVAPEQIGIGVHQDGKLSVMVGSTEIGTIVRSLGETNGQNFVKTEFVPASIS